MTQEVDPGYEATVRDLLERVETELMAAAQGDTPFVTEAARHIIAAGGKRFRPLLVTLASGLTDRACPDDIVKAAIVVELTHVASLYHDDVMDEADLRRGTSSANARWDNNVAILVGDFLFARASSTVAELGVDYVKLQALTFARLVQGQIAETQGPGDTDPLQFYLNVVANKTGSLIATSAVFGGMVAGLGPDQLQALSAYGEEIGVVFQLSDDIIDITSDSTGKTPGTDLREGVSTLPIMLLQASSDPRDARLQDLIRSGLDDDDELAQALALLRSNKVIAQARADVARRAEVARGHLGPLPAGPARDALAALCDDVVSRSR